MEHSLRILACVLTGFAVLCAAALPRFAGAATETLRPNANGASAEWTAVPATAPPTDTYQNVNEAVASDGDYVTASDDAFIDNYNLQNTTFSGADAVNSVTVTVRARSTSNPPPGSIVTSARLKFGIRVGGTNYSATTADIKDTASFANFSNTWATNPATGGPWSKSDIDNLQTYIQINDCTLLEEARRAPGIHFAFIPRARAAATSCDFFVSQMFVSVDYTAAPATEGAVRRVTGGTRFVGKGFVGGSVLVYDGSALVERRHVEHPAGDFAIEVRSEITRDLDYHFVFVDREGGAAPLHSIRTRVVRGVETSHEILPAPTVRFQKSLLAKGEALVVSGYAAPRARVDVYVDGRRAKSADAGAEGEYIVILDTREVAIGAHRLEVRQVFQSFLRKRESEASLTKQFMLSAFGVLRGDLNADGVVNVSDWRYFLGRRDDSAVAALFDFNNDATIDVRDLSIFLSIIVVEG
ncbi:MAG: hypothetical protein HY436_00325 [Candidatus Liptonbacteria bacterium]|nr:hypothetical protein [Candidatus Liptonbacteria bacterium]